MSNPHASGRGVAKVCKISELLGLCRTHGMPCVVNSTMLLSLSCRWVKRVRAWGMSAYVQDSEV